MYDLISPQEFRKFLPNGKQRNSKLSPCGHVAFYENSQNTDGMPTQNYAEEFANWLKRSFLGVADFTGDDDDIAKAYCLIDFKPRLQNLDFDGLECNHVNSLNFSHCTAPSRNETASWEDDWNKFRVDYGTRFEWVTVDNPT